MVPEKRSIKWGILRARSVVEELMGEERGKKGGRGSGCLRINKDTVS